MRGHTHTHQLGEVSFSWTCVGWVQQHLDRTRLSSAVCVSCSLILSFCLPSSFTLCLSSFPSHPLFLLLDSSSSEYAHSCNVYRQFVFEFIAWVMVIMLVMSEVNLHTCMASATCRTWVNDFQRHAWECPLSYISSLFSLKLTGCCVFDCMALGPTVILRALTCLDKGPETGGFSHVLGVVGIISIFMY